MLEQLKAFSHYSRLIYYIDQGLPFSVDEIHEMGGRKSGKTDAIAIFASIACLLDKKIHVYVFRNFSEDLQETFDEFVSIAEGFTSLKLHLSRKEISIGNSKITFKSFHKMNNKNKGKLSGLSGNSKYDYVIVWNEEAYQISKNDMQDQREAVRGCKNILWIFSCNPWTILNDYIKNIVAYYPQNERIISELGQQYFFDPFARKIINYTNWRVNKWVSETEKRDLLELEIINPIRARVASFGLVGMEEGGIYTQLLPKVSRFIKPVTYYSAGLDYGYKKDATACVIVGTDSDFIDLNILGTLKWTNDRLYKNHKEICAMVVDWIYEKAKKHPRMVRYGLTVYCDYSNYAFIEMLSDCARAKGFGNWLYFERCKKLSLEVRVGAKIALMSLNRVNVSMDSQELFNEWQLAVWDTNSTRQIPLDTNNHCDDALDYAIETWIAKLLSHSNQYLYQERRIY